MLRWVRRAPPLLSALISWLPSRRNLVFPALPAAAADVHALRGLSLPLCIRASLHHPNGFMPQRKHGDKGCESLSGKWKAWHTHTHRWGGGQKAWGVDVGSGCSSCHLCPFKGYFCVFSFNVINYFSVHFIVTKKKKIPPHSLKRLIYSQSVFLTFSHDSALRKHRNCAVQCIRKSLMCLFLWKAPAGKVLFTSWVDCSFLQRQNVQNRKYEYVYIQYKKL